MHKNKFTPFILGAAAIALALIVVFVQYNNKKDKVLSYPPQTSTKTTTTATPPVSNTSNSYTLAQVATHKNQSDCWTTINGGVYNVTPWINQHPGGAEAILSLCGINGSAFFNAQHSGQRDPAAELATLKVGTLKK